VKYRRAIPKIHARGGLRLVLSRLAHSPPSLHHFRDAGFSSLVVVLVLGCGFSSARVWLCEDL